MDDTGKQISQSIERIRGLKRGGQYSPFIDFIQFPNYKNFQKDLRVEFAFPLTVVVGQNGSGKSSLLQALYGAPGGYSPGRWWFGTALDPIEGDQPRGQRRRLTAREKAAFWYGYTDADQSREVVKMRIRRRGNPDYWEPSRPIASFGMSLKDGKKRDPAIEMEPRYINLKTQINAFDRCFYYSDTDEFAAKLHDLRYWEKLKEAGRKGAATIQDFLRLRSPKLKSALVEGRTISHRHGSFHRRRVELSATELEEISTIIGREYSGGYLLDHRFYGNWGVSAYFTTNARSYSEAFAGSGESAVAQLVHEVTAGATNRLLLLDEPETSLHPGAQERLLDFLLRNVFEKRLQVVISSHSPVFVRRLPREAIHVLRLGINGKVEHVQGINPDEAFHSIGHPPENVVQIYVEDILAKQVLDFVINAEGEAFSSRIQVSYRPGGTDEMKQDAANLQNHEFRERVFYVFDGDQEPTTSAIDLQAIGIQATVEDIDRLIRNNYGCRIRFRQNSNMQETEKRQARLEFINYANAHFHCMPFDTPEEAIWQTDVARFLLEASAPDKLPQLAEIEELPPKERFSTLASLTQPEHEPTDSTQINHIQRMFLNRFVEDQAGNYVALKNLIVGIVDDA